MLPFVNGSGDQSKRYFFEGLSEDLITTLSGFSGSKVINGDSAFQLRNNPDSVQIIGKKLGVVHLMEGRVQFAGDIVRVSGGTAEQRRRQHLVVAALRPAVQGFVCLAGHYHAIRGG